MTFAESATRDLLRAIADVPLTFTWDDVDYTGTRGALVERRGFGSGGFLEAPDLTITACLKKLNGAGKLVPTFPDDTPPEIGNKLTIDEVEYRIEVITKDEFEAGIMFDLGSTSRGAQ